VAYDPSLTSFIIVGIVGGVAVVMNASSEWEISHELSRATDNWRALQVVRSYGDNPAAERMASREAAILEAHGYRPMATGGRSVVPDTLPSGGTAITYSLAELQ
jgi:hypothetical protein